MFLKLQFIRSNFQLSAAILFAEPRLIRISTFIWAREFGN
jgi:hypothetical protein